MVPRGRAESGRCPATDDNQKTRRPYRWAHTLRVGVERVGLGACGPSHSPPSRDPTSASSMPPPSHSSERCPSTTKPKTQRHPGPEGSGCPGCLATSHFVELEGIEPSSARQLTTALRPFPRRAVTAGSLPGQVGLRPPLRLSGMSVVFPTVSVLSRRQPLLLLPGCSGLAPCAIAGHDVSLC